MKWSAGAILVGASLAGTASAQVLANESVVISSGAGGSGGGAQTSDMIFSDTTPSWSGGAVGVQGSAGINDTGGSTAAANVAFKYDVGGIVDSLNTEYGAGDWSIANPELTFQYTLYANNSRFNSGPGTFSIFWMANDSWVQGTSDPVYATSASALAAWAGNVALLGSENYAWTTPGYTGTLADLHDGNWVTDKTGVRQSTVSYGLALDPNLVNDITSASAASNPNVSLYLMGTSSTLGLCIFTGGGSTLPTLSFEVVAAPEPSTLGLTACGLAGLITVWRRRNTK